MKTSVLLRLSGLAFVLMLSGCTVRHYTVATERVDQNLEIGNRGYLAGQMPPTLENAERKTTRETFVTEIELPDVKRVGNKPQEQAPAPQPQREVTPIETPVETQEAPEYAVNIPEKTEPPANIAQPPSETFQAYTVVSGDTLQKISMKFYGTTKQWPKIYDANKDKLKAPDKLYKGQVLNIPVEKMKETRENLK